jgi:phage-related protein
MGDSLKQIKAMPEEVQKTIGWQLQQAQVGDMPGLAKPFKGVAIGVFEIRKSYDTDTYRAVYAVQIGESIYVLHAFQKKAKKGIATPKKNVDLIRKRYKEAVQLERQKQKGKDDE